MIRSCSVDVSKCTKLLTLDSKIVPSSDIKHHLKSCQMLLWFWNKSQRWKQRMWIELTRKVRLRVIWTAQQKIKSLKIKNNTTQSSWPPLKRNKCEAKWLLYSWNTKTNILVQINRLKRVVTCQVRWVKQNSRETLTVLALKGVFLRTHVRPPSFRAVNSAQSHRWV